MTLRQDTGNRERLPTVQRHNYCQPGRNNDPWIPYDYNTVYCFCNDQNGCNKTSYIFQSISFLVLALTVNFLTKYIIAS